MSVYFTDTGITSRQVALRQVSSCQCQLFTNRNGCSAYIIEASTTERNTKVRLPERREHIVELQSRLSRVYGEHAQPAECSCWSETPQMSDTTLSLVLHPCRARRCLASPWPLPGVSVSGSRRQADATRARGGLGGASGSRRCAAARALEPSSCSSLRASARCAFSAGRRLASLRVLAANYFGFVL